MPQVDARWMHELQREAAELRASRTRVVIAADDQRRLIERELHDGVLQHLVALAVDLQLARRLLDADSPGLAERLDEMLRNVHEALEEMRQLSWRVYPSLLLDRGLDEALRSAASVAGISTHVETAAIGRCEPGTEASVYLCCVGLLHDAADGGHHATIRVRSEGEMVLFDVAVEGADIEDWKTRDLSSFSDRLGAFGGRLSVVPVLEPERGVRISGAIPRVPQDQVLVLEPSPTSAR